MRFEFSTATRIIFGEGTFKELPLFVSQLGTSTFIVDGNFNKYTDTLIEQLKAANIKSSIFNVSDEPSIGNINQGLEIARKNGCDVVISIGGGSVIDTGKVIAALLTNGGELLDYLEVIGKAKPLSKRSMPFIAIPTTAGTGSEVTSNSVIFSQEHKQKVSIRSILMLPHLAIIDPSLTCSMPPLVTASTGMDALTQLIEAFISNKANPITDALCKDGIKRAARSLQLAYTDSWNMSAREDMSLAGLLSGIALMNAKLGAVHGIAGPMGGMLPIPHGIICANLLYPVMEMNVKALKSRQPDSPILDRIGEIFYLLTDNPIAEIVDGLEWIKDIFESLNIPKLSKYGLREELFISLVEKSQKASSMKGNPIKLNDEEILEILGQTV